MPINVVNKYTFKGTVFVYIGRPSALGNPFKVATPAERGSAIVLFRDYLPEAYSKGGKVKKAIDDLVVKFKAGEEINLLCFCAPRPCHGDVIREFVERLAGNEQGQDRET